MAEHGDRVKAATKATTLGGQRSLVSDLQTGNSGVQLPALRPPRALVGSPGTWGLRLVSAAVLVTLGVGIGWGLYGNTGSPFSLPSDPGAKTDGVAPVVLNPPRQLHSLGGLTGLLEQAREKFGDTVGYRMVIFPDYAVFDRPDPGDDRRTLSYAYRGGWGDPSTGPKSADAVAVDLGKFDVRAVVGVLRGAPETLGIKPAEVRSSYLLVEPSRDPTTPGAVAISIYVSSEFASGYVQINPDGSIKHISNP